VAALARHPRFRRLGEGEGERLVVRVEDETHSLQHEAEVADPLHTGQQLPVVGRVANLGRVQLLGEELQQFPGSGRGRPLLQGCPYMLRGHVHHQGQLCLGPGEGQAGGRPQGVLGRLERSPHLFCPHVIIFSVIIFMLYIFLRYHFYFIIFFSLSFLCYQFFSIRIFPLSYFFRYHFYVIIFFCYHFSLIISYSRKRDTLVFSMVAIHHSKALFKAYHSQA